MKDWKAELLTALEEQAVDLKEVRIYDVAKAHGYNHIPNHDVLDIVNAFQKRHPDYRPVIMLDYEGQNASLFTHGVLTSLEYENGDETA